MMAYYADFRGKVGFRCLAVEILEGPIEDSFLGELTFYYRVRFLDEIAPGVYPDPIENDIPAYHIFDHPIELVDLPKECYWGPDYDDF